MARIDRGDLAVSRRIGRIEVMGADGKTLQADAEQLALDTILHVVILLREDLVQGILQDRTVEVVVDGLLLAAVVDPQVHNAGIALGLAYLLGDGAAALGVLDPKIADILVRVGQGEVAALGMREGSGIEVQLGAVLLTPFDPALEMFGLHFVAIDELAAEVAVDLVEVEPVHAGDQALRFEDVGL